MKKLAIITAMVVLVTAAVFGQETYTEYVNQWTTYTLPADVSQGVQINAKLQGYLYLTGLNEYSNILLNTNGAEVQVAEGSIATNLRNWDLTVASLNGSNLKATTEGTSYNIPYTFKLTGGTTIGNAFESNGNEGWIQLTTSGVTKNYSNRVTGGTTGEIIKLYIQYGAENTSTWFANLVYSDTITVTVKVR